MCLDLRFPGTVVAEPFRNMPNQISLGLRQFVFNYE